MLEMNRETPIRSSDSDTVVVVDDGARRRKRIAIICGTCGSDEVSRDAWANWDVAKQNGCSAQCSTTVFVTAANANPDWSKSSWCQHNN